MMSDYFIRPFDPAKDMKEFVCLNVQTFFKHAWTGSEEMDDAFRAAYREYFYSFRPDDPEVSLILICTNKASEYLGHIWASAVVTVAEPEAVPWIMDLSFKKEHRNPWALNALAGKMMTMLKKEGHAKVDAHVAAHNARNYRLFQRYGFKPIAHSLRLML